MITGHCVPGITLFPGDANHYILLVLNFSLQSWAVCLGCEEEDCSFGLPFGRWFRNFVLSGAERSLPQETC